MAASLKALLDQVPGARQVLPYLAALEGGLAAEGTGVLDVIPMPSLQRMGTQLAGLPLDPEDRPLRALQVELLAALARRSAPTSMPAFVPSALGPDKFEVTEIGDSELAAASGLFETQPADLQPR
jgi:hypothetical protein